MTHDFFNVDTDVLRQQGQQFVALRNDFTQSSKRLQSDLEGLGEPWADAEFGGIFGDIYTPIRDGLFTAMDSLAERLGQIGDTLQENAHDYDSADTSNSGLMDGLAGQL